MNRGSWALPGLVTFIHEIFQCHPALLPVWLGAACPPMNWGCGSPASSCGPWCDFPLLQLPRSPTSPHHVHTGNPSATSGQLGTPMLTLTVSSFESWDPSPPTQLSPYPQLPAQVHPTHHPSIWHLSLSLPIGLYFLEDSNPPGVVLAVWSDLLPHGWLHLGWRSSKPLGKGRAVLAYGLHRLHFSCLLPGQAKVPLLSNISPCCCSQYPSSWTGGAS